MKNKAMADTRLQHTLKKVACGGMASGIDWTEKMFSIRHLRNAIPSAFKIAATKIGDDVESDICISHLRLTISH